MVAKREKVASTGPGVKTWESSGGGGATEEILKALRYFRRSPLAIAGATIVTAWILVSIFAGQVAPYGPLQQDIVNRLQGPSATHLMGTDQLGRDVLSRIIYG